MPLDLQIYQLNPNPTLADTDVFASDNSSHLTYKNTLLQLQNYLTSGLSAGQILYVSSSNKLTASSGFSWNDAIKKLTIDPTGSLDVGTFSISGSDIISSDTFNLSSQDGLNISVFNSDVSLGDSSHTRSAIFNFNNHAGDAATGLRAGNPSTTTVYTLPLTYPTGTQALTSNSSGIMSWASFGSGSVTNVSGVNANGFSFNIANPTTTPAITLSTSLTAGSVVFAGAGGSSLSENNSKLFWDSSNNFLGVGTATPQKVLEVSGVASTSAPGTAFIRLNNTHGNSLDQFGILFTNYTNGLASGNFAGSAAINCLLNTGGGSAQLHFLVDGSIGMMLTENLDLGINVSTVLNKLDVAGAAAIGAYAGVNVAPTNGLIVSGNVGIGTSSPGAGLALDVAGNVSLSGILSAGNFTINGDLIVSTGPAELRSGSGQDIYLQVNQTGATNGINIIDVNGALAIPLKFFDPTVGHYTGLKAGSTSVNTIYTLPIAFPSSTQALVSSNTGVMSFQALTSGTVTSITAGNSNIVLSPGTITTTGSVALASDLTNVNSAIIANFNIGQSDQSSIIHSSASDDFTLKTLGFGHSINLTPDTTGSINLKNGSAAVPLNFYNSASTHFVGLRAGTLSADTTFTLPTANVTNGILQSDSSSNWSLTLTPAGLTSIGVGVLSISGMSITNSGSNSGLALLSGGSGSTDLFLGVTGGGSVRIYSPANTNAVPLLFTNAAGTAYAALQSPTSPSNTIWKLPAADAAGGWVSDGSANLSIKAQADGELLIGSTGTSPVAATLTQGAGISITNGPGSIIISSSGAISYEPTFVQGYRIDYSSTIKLTIGAGIVKSLSTSYDIVNITDIILDITASGINGLDTGSVAANRIYSIFSIYNPITNDTQTLASLSVTGSPDVPVTGYTEWRQIGWWVTDGSANLVQLYQTGIYNQRVYNYCDIVGGVNRVLTAGSATVETPVDCSSFVPYGCLQIVLQASLSGAVVGSAVSLRNDDLFGQPIKMFNTSAATSDVKYPPLSLSVARKLDYKWDTAAQSLTLDIISFVHWI